MIDIEVKDFQSIQHASLQVRGFTALVGRSNLGKSALVRAVKAALTGAAGTDFVRHHASCPRRVKGTKTCKCQCSVHIKTEGFDLLWEKGDAINQYTFNGAVYNKAERGTPEFLQPLYSLVKVGDSKELLQVSDQFDPIFLLNQTGGVVADVLSDVARLDRVNVAIRYAEKDRKEAVATRKVREQDVVDLTQRLVAFDGLDRTLADVHDVDTRLDTIERAESRVSKIEGYLVRGGVLGQQIDAINGALKVESPVPDTLSTTASVYTQSARFHTQYSEREKAVSALQIVTSVHVPDSSTLSSTTTLFERLDGWIVKLRLFKAWRDKVKGLDDVPRLDSASMLEGMSRYELICKLQSRYTALVAQVETLRTQETTLVTEAGEVQAAWDSLGVCPTCTQPLRTEAHAHLT